MTTVYMTHGCISHECVHVRNQQVSMLQALGVFHFYGRTLRVASLTFALQNVSNVNRFSEWNACISEGQQSTIKQ